MTGSTAAAASLDTSRTAIVTGASSGLGLECAGALVREGWHVVLAVRDLERGQATAERFGNHSRCSVMAVDLASLASVRRFAADYQTTSLPPTRALICNAGLQVVSGEERSADGFELTFAVNHLGHFALVQGLLHQLAERARIIVVGSGTHDPENRTGMPAPRYTSAEQLAHPDSEPAEPIGRLGRRRYTTSKLCNVLFAYELDRRLRREGSEITVNVFDPGLMPGSGLARDYSRAQRLAWRLMTPLLRLHPHVHSTRTSGVRLAALAGEDRYEGLSGRYFLGTKAIKSSSDSHDLDKAADLWSTSEQLVDDQLLAAERRR